MARARNIKPSIMANDDLADLPPLDRLLFIYLWMLVDRQGRMRDKPRKIKAQAFPYDDVDCEQALQRLHDSGFIYRYEVNGTEYLQVVNFSKHQNPHKKEKDSEIPEPENEDRDEHHTSTVQTPYLHTNDPADSGYRIPDSGYRIPDSGYRIPDSSSAKEANGCSSTYTRACEVVERMTDKDKSPKKRNRPDNLPASIADDLWSEFKEHRKKIKAPMTDVAETRAANKLAKMNDPAGAIEDSIINGWKGIFEPQEARNGKNRSSNGAERSQSATERFWDRNRETAREMLGWPSDG